MLTVVSLISAVPALAGSHALQSHPVVAVGIPRVKAEVHVPVPVLMANAAVPLGVPLIDPTQAPLVNVGAVEISSRLTGA